MKRIDLTGRRFGKLTVLNELTLINGKLYWHCQCDCGNKWDVNGEYLRNGQSNSCGCIRAETMGNTARTHGLSKRSEYKIWSKIKDRCYNVNSDNYRHYGGRGIKVCARWLESFENFLSDMGDRPSMNHSVDRFPDKNGDYDPSNCRWATQKQQTRNQKNNVSIQHDGHTLTIIEWAEKLNIRYSMLRWKLKSGMPFPEIVKLATSLSSD